MAAALRRDLGIVFSVSDDRPQQEIASRAWKLEVVVYRLLAERSDRETSCLTGYSFALCVFQRESDRALDLPVFIIDQHYL